MIILIKRMVLNFRLCCLRLKGCDADSPNYLGPDLSCTRGLSSEHQPGHISTGPGIHIERGVVLNAFGGEIRIGRDTFLGPYAVIYGHGGVEIGDACLISMHCRILSSNHAIPPVRNRH